jgi:hypothetical protein
MNHSPLSLILDKMSAQPWNESDTNIGEARTTFSFPYIPDYMTNLLNVFHSEFWTKQALDN